jgi:Rps23 Pro-64 3,4-dihydroxylase Tpa1-like proline 4-hydroxylase
MKASKTAKVQKIVDGKKKKRVLRKYLENSSVKSAAPTGESLSPDLFSRVGAYRHFHDNVSHPFKHVVIDNLCPPNVISSIHEECIHHLKANFKETDLFKVYQTGDLTTIDQVEPGIVKKLPALLKLRDTIYSKKFRTFVSDMLGCGELTDRMDCSSNAYANGCHLLCHDDVIGTRKVSYIIYISDPNEPWRIEDGGALELYPLDQKTAVKITTPDGLVRLLIHINFKGMMTI